MSEAKIFANGLFFIGSPCTSIGHSENPLPAYDFKGMVSYICPRPMCHEIVKQIAVDDLPAEDYEDLMVILDRAMHFEDDDDDEHF